MKTARQIETEYNSCKRQCFNNWKWKEFTYTSFFLNLCLQDMEAVTKRGITERCLNLCLQDMYVASGMGQQKVHEKKQREK